MPALSISDIALKRFCYCPRWYFISYILGFNPKSPVKAKFVISDALQALLTTRKLPDFATRCQDLIRAEEMAEEDVALEEMLARGELLAEELLKWQAKIKNINWQEQLVKFSLEDCSDIEFETYPKLVGEHNGKNTLFHFRTSYDATSPMDLLGYYYRAVLQAQGLKQAGIDIQKQVLVSCIVRTRKERYSTRAKTPIAEVREEELSFDHDMYLNHAQQIAKTIANATETGIFPALGVVDGTCIWCPNGKSLRDKSLCNYPDDILKQFVETSLQRASIERWRDEF